MRIFLIPLIILWFFTLGMAVCPANAFSQKEDLAEQLKKKVNNFHEAAPGLYRSGLISEEAHPLLKELGIRTVLNFDNDSKRADREEASLKRVGIKTIRIPWSGWDEPKDEDISKVLSMMQSAEMKPVLVHCKHGQERTGVAIACWRMAHQGWSVDQAYREMRTYGFRPFRYGHLKKYVYHFARAHGKQKAEIRNVWERAKTRVLSFFYRLRKLNPLSTAVH